MTLLAGTRFDAYEIIAPIGRGGMGEVYRAKDTRLNREVAIKVLPEDLAQNADALKRFEREAILLASLSHPNILTIHDVGTEQGISFVLTELLDGETLRWRIARGPLSWQKALQIAIPVADGLAAAHSKGVIHRDLKPENVFLISDGRVKILDFGLACFRPPVPQEQLTEVPTLSRATESGIVLGTVPYMSPEQVRGKSVDARTDIFSFGCLLYEMLTAQRTFSGNSNAEITASILRDEPSKLTEIPPELDHVISHCLEKNPEQRFQSARDLAFELREIESTSGVVSRSISMAGVRSPLKKTSIRIAIAGLAIIVLMIALNVSGLRERFGGKPQMKPINSLAVLPLKNLSGDSNQEYFADGMTDELIAKLARIESLRIISRTSVMEYKIKQKPIAQIAKELNVDGIVEGSVMKAGNRVRITAQLIHAPTDRHLWTESYERDMRDILALQNEVASDIAREIKVRLTTRERAQFALTTKVNPEAYDAYLHGIQYMGPPLPARHETELAITMFKRAIEIDPNFGRAFAELSIAYSWMYTLSLGHAESTEKNLIKAKQAIDRAFQIQPGLPEAHIAMGYYYFRAPKNYEQALQQFTIAQQAIPNDKSLLIGFASVYLRQGKFHEALQSYLKILDLDPRDAGTADYVALVYDVLGESTEAQRYFDLAISLAPDLSKAYVAKVRSYLKWTGDTKGARAIILKMPDENTRNMCLQMLEMLEHNYQAALNLLPLSINENYENALLTGDCYRLMNKPDEARKSYNAARIELEKLIQNNPKNPLLHSYLSFAYAGLSRKEDAIHEAKTAVELYPISNNAVWAPVFVKNQAIVSVRIGEYEAALDQIEYLLSIPTFVAYGLSVPMLRIDPTWDPLRGHPRFQKILEKYSHKQG